MGAGFTDYSCINSIRVLHKTDGIQKWSKTQQQSHQIVSLTRT